MSVMILNNADAQTKTSKKKSFNNNYSVCRNQAGNYICSSDQMKAQNQRREVAPPAIEPQNEVINIPSSTVVADKPTMTASNSYRFHNFIVNDEMDNPANGLPSQQYDGPAKNDQRNINYNQTQLSLRASDGSK